DRVVDNDDAATRHVCERVVLQADPLLSQGLIRLDKRAADVPVLHEPFAERDPGRAREADRGGRAPVRDPEHADGVDPRLGGELLAHPNARRVHLDAAEPRVGPGQVEELEQAERAARGWYRLNGLAAAVVHEDEFSGSKLALQLGADEIERARLRGDDP